MSTAASRYDVIISGASFAGLALARGLAQALGPGLRIAIVDRAVAPVAMGQDARAFAVWAGGKATLDALGVWPALAADAEVMRTIEISDSAADDGVRATRLTYDAMTDDGQPAAYIVPAGKLHQALYQALDGADGVSFIAPAEATGLTLGPVSADVALSDGRVLSAALCVAAEGRGSALRDAAGIKTVGWAYGQSGIVATIAFAQPHGGVGIQHFLPGGPFAVLPMTGNRACITWSTSTENAARLSALSDDAFVAELDGIIGGRFGAITLAGPRGTWPLNVKLARQLTAQRFALIGDAAHGVHPIAGQGVNLALRDVAALVEVLADAARLGFDLGHAPALERYARWRRFDSMMSAAMYDGLNQAFRLDNPILRAGRGAGLGLLDRLPQVKQWIMSEAAGVTGEVPKLARGLAV